MKRIICLLLLLPIVFSLSSCNNPVTEKSDGEPEKSQTQSEKQEKHLKMLIDGKEFDVLLEDNETAEVFEKSLPMSLLMSELNGNEKYHYLDYALPNNEQSVVTVKKGDIMLYGDRCIVVFYKSFVTAYKYTKIGHIENTDQLEEAVGDENIIIEFTY